MSNPVICETLEARRLMTADFVGPVLASEATDDVPAVVAARRPVQTTVVTNPNRVPLPGTIFNAFSGMDNVPSRISDDFIWAAPFHFGTDSNGVYDYSEAKVRSIARWIRDGGQNWRYDYTAPKNFAVIDVEWIGETSDYIQRVANIVGWFKDEAPNVAVGLYGFAFTHRIREYFDNQDAQGVREIHAEFESARSVFRQVDAVVQDMYLMGPERVATDLEFMKNFAWYSRAHYPDLPVVAWTWGNYHTAWNPDYSPLGMKVAKKYAKACWENFDAIVAWGPAEQNQRWASVLGTMKNWKVNVSYSLNTSQQAQAYLDETGAIYRVSLASQILPL